MKKLFFLLVMLLLICSATFADINLDLKLGETKTFTTSDVAFYYPFLTFVTQGANIVSYNIYDHNSKIDITGTQVGSSTYYLYSEEGIEWERFNITVKGTPTLIAATGAKGVINNYFLQEIIAKDGQPHFIGDITSATSSDTDTLELNKIDNANIDFIPKKAGQVALTIVNDYYGDVETIEYIFEVKDDITPSLSKTAGTTYNYKDFNGLKDNFSATVTDNNTSFLPQDCDPYNNVGLWTMCILDSYYIPYMVTFEVTYAPVESITVAPETLKLKVGDETTLTAKVLPATADQTVTWKTGNEKVATVDQDGNVKVVGVGVTYIKATTNGRNSEGDKLFMDCILRVDKDNVESISLNKDKLTLSLGSDETLVPTVLPESANYKKVGWTVGNPKVATVDQTGKVTAVGYGTTCVYCTTYATDTEGNRLKARCIVTVTSDPVESVTIPEEKELSLGDEYSLTATVLPTTAIQDVTWTVGNKNVATVDKTGKVTAVGYGITYVTVITKGLDANGNRLKSRCKIVVSSDPAESITLSETEITLSVGDEETLTATVAPETTDQSVTWTIGNKKVATIDKTGKVTAVGAGSTYVTVFSKAKDANGNRLKTRCKVVVLSEPF